MRFGEYIHHGWPYAILVALREIDPGEELLVDYGDKYWNGTVDVYRDMTTDYENEQSILVDQAVGFFPYNPIVV